MHKLKINKAAMFGLDARIALAIFGALSVISGAALYSAIQQAKTTAVHTSLIEMAKASDQYYLDTGQQLPFQTGSTVWLTNSYLVTNTNNANGWKGPYLNYEINTPMHIYFYYNGVRINSSIYIAANDDWTAHDSTGKVFCSTKPKNCYEWIVLDANSSSQHNLLEELFSKLDEQFDSSNGKGLGSIRMKDQGAVGDDNRIYIRGRARPI
tara:strand:- start:12488 stop:13117 length:630 start_codon:yes stop_codon:yes gene_type:complete